MSIKAIAIETSGRIGSAALAESGQVLSQQTFPHGLQHAAKLIPLLDALLQTKGWKPADLDEIYLSIGPGSFTGLRVGVTIAKVLAMTTRARIVPVPSLRVLAENAPADAQNILILLDARRGSVFAAHYQRAAHGLIERQSAHLDTLDHALADLPHPTFCLGEGVKIFHRELSAHPGLIIAPPDTAQPHATATARIGWAMARADHFADPYTLTPLYLRKPEAQEKFENQLRQKQTPHPAAH